MRNLLAITLLSGAFCGALRADFRYDSRTQLSGGNLGSRKPAVATHYIKGGRMATLTKDHITVVDVDKETILEIDLAKKTYFSMTFAKMKQIIEQAKSKDASSDATFKVSSKSSGRTKSMGLWNANEQIVTGTMEGAKPETPHVARILVDSWMMVMPGYSEVEDYRRKLALKLGYAYALGMSEIGITEPELIPGFEELGKKIGPSDDMPVESTIRMGGPESGDLGENGIGPSSSEKSGIVSGALSRLGKLGHKQTNGDQESAPPGMLIEITTELSNFSSGPVEEAKFSIPPGLKEIQFPAVKTEH